MKEQGRREEGRKTNFNYRRGSVEGEHKSTGCIKLDPTSSLITHAPSLTSLFSYSFFFFLFLNLLLYNKRWLEGQMRIFP